MWRTRDSLIEQIGLDLFFSSHRKRRERVRKGERNERTRKKKLRANKNVS
jgi:hypothetical protein